MRLKTLGVLLVVATAAFTMLYWVTDNARREQIATGQEEELLEFGEVIFSDDPSEPALRTASLANKISVNPNYVPLAVSYGGVVVSGNVNSPMPAWSSEVGGPLNEQQIEAVVTLVESWAEEAAEEAPEEVEDTVEAGAEVYSAAGCAGCHGQELEGGTGPNLQTIGTELADLSDF